MSRTYRRRWQWDGTEARLETGTFGDCKPNCGMCQRGIHNTRRRRRERAAARAALRRNPEDA